MKTELNWAGATRLFMMCTAWGWFAGCNNSQPTPQPEAQPEVENDESEDETVEFEPTSADLVKTISLFGQNLGMLNYDTCYGLLSKSLQQNVSAEEFAATAKEHLDPEVAGTSRMGSSNSGLTEARGGKSWSFINHPPWSADVPEEQRVGRGFIVIGREKLGYLQVAVTVVQEGGELRIEQYKFGGDELSKKDFSNRN